MTFITGSMQKLKNFKIIRFLVAVVWLQVFLIAGTGPMLSSHAAEASKEAKALYESARNSYYTLVKSPSKKAYRQHWMETIQRFQKVIRQHPESYESYKATFTLGRLYQGLASISGLKEDRAKAAGYFEQTATRFPVNRLTDDALFSLAKIHLSEKNSEAARRALQKIVQDMPKSDQVGAARKLLQSVPQTTPRSEPVVPKARQARLYDLGYENSPGRAQVTLRVEGDVTFARKNSSNNHFHWVFHNARWDASVPTGLDPSKGLLQDLKIARDPSGYSWLEVVLPEGQGIAVKSSQVGLDLILDFEKAGAAPRQVHVKSVEPVFSTAKAVRKKPKPVVEEKPKAVAAKPEKNRRKKGERLIVLDPGHGGKDDGAKGRSGLLEKDLNLEIAGRVQKILQKRYKIKSVLTRTDDTFIELKERGDIANRLEADLFVSIHANAAPRKSARGIETYFLGSGSSDRALETAARENGELVESVEDDDVQQILASLISTTKINESARLAADVQKRLAALMHKKFTKVNNLGVKEGPFYVLHRTNMPSILVEVGFVTNRHEERRLKQNSYQYWLAESIAQGIYRFLKDKAPSI